MPLYTSKSVLLGLTALFSAVAFTASADEITTFTKGGTAIGGTDPVAYFTEGKPVAGTDEFTAVNNDVTWKFSSAENRDLFEADPAKYAPQYGGYCAWAIAQGKTAKGDARRWAVVDGKLYLNYNKGIQKRWDKKRAEFITSGDQNWPTVLQD